MFYDQTLCYGFGLLSWAKFLKLLCVFGAVVLLLKKTIKCDRKFWGKRTLKERCARKRMSHLAIRDANLKKNMSGRLGKARIMLENARTFYFLSFDFQLIFHSVRLHHGKMDKPTKSTNKKQKN